MAEKKASDSRAVDSALIGKATSFHTLYRILFPESDRTMFEYSTGLKKTVLTSRQAGRMVAGAVPSVARRLSGVEKGSEVGLFMHSEVKWTAVFWALLMNGYRPVLIGTEDCPERCEGLADVIRDDDGITTDEDGCIPPESSWADGFCLRMGKGPARRYDVEAVRSAVIEAMDMPHGSVPEVRALVAAPLSSKLGLFSLLALQAMGAVAVFPPQGRLRSVSDCARSHDVTHMISYPLELSMMASRMRRRQDGQSGKGDLDKALSAHGPLWKLRYGSLFRKVRNEMTGPSVEVIYTIDDDLNPQLISFFSRLGYTTGYLKDCNGYRPEPVENAMTMAQVRSACLVRPQVGKPVLLVSLESGMSSRRTAAAMELVKKAASGAGAEGLDIAFTTGDLSRGGFRLDRGRLSEELAAGRISLLRPETVPPRKVFSEEEVRSGVARCFANTLDRPVEEITYTGDFFTTFGGESLDYFVLLGNLESMFDIELSSRDGSRLSSVKALTRYILDHQED